MFPSENEMLVKKNVYQFSLTKFQMMPYKIVKVLPAVGSCTFETVVQELLAPVQLQC